MRRVCPGWTEPPHPEKFLGHVGDPADDSVSHGICQACAQALGLGVYDESGRLVAQPQTWEAPRAAWKVQTELLLMRLAAWVRRL